MRSNKTLADLLTESSNITHTEKGEVALKSTTNGLLDFYGVAGALRTDGIDDIVYKFEQAAGDDLLLAMKILFYARDIRGGLGERRLFRDLLHYLGNSRPEVVKKNIDIVAEFGRFDDLYSLVGTKAEDDMWNYIGAVLKSDLDAMEHGDSVSLLAKWISPVNSASEKTRKFALYTAKKLGYAKSGFTTYRRNLVKLRKYIDVVEVKMCDKKFDEIDYSKTPSKAMLKYREAFKRHDYDRYSEFIDKVVSGEVNMNAGTVTPYDIISKVMQYGDVDSYAKEGKSLEASWKSLPDMLKEETNVMCVVDTSGSMIGRPIEVAVGLGMYFAERNKGVWHNKFINFSNEAHFCTIPNGNLFTKVQSIKSADWQMSTNIESVMRLILETAVNNGLSQDELPRGLVIISDMQYDPGYNQIKAQGTFHDKVKEAFRRAGYELPNIIYWNVRNTKAAFQARADEHGVQLASGESINVFRQIVQTLDMNPYDAMMEVLNSERYSCVRI